MSHVIGHGGEMSRFFNLHRVIEMDEYSAPEGGVIRNSEELTQGRGPIPKIPRNRKAAASPGYYWSLLMLLLMAALMVGVWGWLS